MAKSSTYLLRLDPQKKARRAQFAKDAGISLAEWIELACEAFEIAPVEKPTLKDMAREAREQHNRGETTPLHQEAECDLRPFERKPVGKALRRLEEAEKKEKG